MKFYVKQKVFSLGEQFTVKNELGEDCYFVEGEWFSIPKTFRIYDRQNREVLTLRQKPFSFSTRFQILRGDTVAAEIVREFSFFGQSYRIEGSPFSVGGEVFAHDYTIYRDGSPVAQISKEWFTWGDSYVLDNYNGEDEQMLLAILIVIDCVLSRD